MNLIDFFVSHYKTLSPLDYIFIAVFAVGVWRIMDRMYALAFKAKNETIEAYARLHTVSVEENNQLYEKLRELTEKHAAVQGEYEKAKVDRDAILHNLRVVSEGYVNLFTLAMAGRMTTMFGLMLIQYIGLQIEEQFPEAPKEWDLFMAMNKWYRESRVPILEAGKFILSFVEATSSKIQVPSKLRDYPVLEVARETRDVSVPVFAYIDRIMKPSEEA